MKEEYLLTGELEYTNEPYALAKIAGIKMCESYNIQYKTNFIAVQPTNLYGPNDNFDLEKSHVLPALIRKIHLGKALENNDWETVRKDLNKLPIEGISGNNSEEEILNMLAKYGIIKSQNTDHKSQISDLKSQISVEIWGSGKPMREFLWSEDMADACVYLMEKVDFEDIISKDMANPSVYPPPNTGRASSPIMVGQADPKGSGSVESKILNTQYSILNTEIRNTHINIGTGKEISIKELAEVIKKTVGFQGELVFNSSKPDGTMRKLTDSSKLAALGWKYAVELEEGIERMYDWYLEM
jgi:GDP-L-fucose synthase